MNDLENKLIEEMVPYFENCSKNDISFLPEFKISKKVFEQMKTNNFLPQKIVDEINEINQLDHYNSCGWYDFLIKISRILSDSKTRWIIEKEDEKMFLRRDSPEKVDE